MKNKVLSMMDTRTKKAGAFIACLVLIIALGIGVIIAANTAQNGNERDTLPPPGQPAPMVHIAGRIFNRCPEHGRAVVRLDDTFEFVGEIESYSWLFQDVTENFQTNSSHLIGARLYWSEKNDELIVEINDYKMLYRFIGEYVKGWPQPSK